SGNEDGEYNDEDYVFKDGKKTTTLRGKKNKDVTTRFLVKEGGGEDLKEKLLAYRAVILELIDEEDKASFSKEIPEIIDDAAWKDKYGDKPGHSWSTFNFKQMPVQAVLPILRKFQNDVISTESSLLTYLAGKVGTTTDLVIDKFTVVSAPEKTYVINGEPFKTEVFLTASASKESNVGMTLSVNGKPLSINDDGVASFTQTASGTGKKSYTVEGSIKNPTTDEIQRFKKTYEYEVGERSATISASKMNVFYIGVENPVEVSVAGVASNKVNVSMAGNGGGTIKKQGDGTFVVSVTKPTPLGQFAKVTVSADGFSADKNFRVKRIPSPVPTLSKNRGGAMPSGPFKAQGGILPVLENFDFEAKCNIAGFNLVRVPKRQDAELASNPGGAYRPEAKRIVMKAVAGDKYFFENIKCKCPGDAAARDLGTMVFTIK
ncbi:MAG: gliding motility-associated protein GldM, partial [Saprospiraceae bacterium]